MVNMEIWSDSEPQAFSVQINKKYCKAEIGTGSVSKISVRTLIKRNTLETAYTVPK